jgi:photosystem II stability/assembly factor-like uncharacterized protein
MLELKHLGSRRILPALIVTFAIIATGCGGARAKPGGEAATREAAASPSGLAPAQVRAASPVWIDTLQMMSSTTGWALLWPSNPNGDSALAVARTTDGGRTWTVVTAPAAVRALGTGQALLDAATAERAWFAVPTSTSGPSGKTLVFGTMNAGRSWQKSAVAGNDPVAIDFVSPSRGWLLESLGAAMQQNPVRLYRSTDGGVRWSLVARSPRMAGDPATSSGLPLYCDKYGLAFASARTGWITSYCNSLTDAILVTRDGGSHWTSEPVPLPATLCESAGCEIPAPQSAGGTTFLEVSDYPGAAYLLVSRDAGRSWQVESLPAGAGPYPRIRFFSADDGIAVSAGSQGTIGRVFYVSTDGGLSWTGIRQGRHFGGNWADFDFVSVRAGFAWVYPGGESTAALPHLYWTSDTGRRWASFVPRLS